MKIKAKNPNIASMKLIVPIDGLITIDANGEVEVSTQCALCLVKNTNDWEYATKPIEEVTAYRLGVPDFIRRGNYRA